MGPKSASRRSYPWSVCASALLSLFGIFSQRAVLVALVALVVWVVFCVFSVFCSVVAVSFVVVVWSRLSAGSCGSGS